MTNPTGEGGAAPHGDDRSIACPDCAAAGLPLDHDGTCPAAAAADRLMEQDRAWFDAHPDATEYRRPMRPGDLGLPDGTKLRPHGRVLVKQLAPGVRVRVLPPCDLLGNPDSPTAAYVAAMIGNTAELPHGWAEHLGGGDAR